MTDQPTAWTTEIDLAIGSLVDSAQAGANAKRWPMNAAKKLREVIAAEIERQKARADAAERERDGWRREESKCVRVARDTLGSDAPAHLSTIADCVVSLGALVERLRAELAAKQPVKAEAAQQGPSDEEIRDAIESVHMCGDNVTANALRLVARRAGVKL